MKQIKRYHNVGGVLRFTAFDYPFFAKLIHLTQINDHSLCEGFTVKNGRVQLYLYPQLYNL